MSDERPQVTSRTVAERPAHSLGQASRANGMPDWSPNLIDYRHSVVVAMTRAEQDDETLEICPHCECEVDVTPAPHRPGCAGIGKPRASSATSVSERSLKDLSKPAKPGASRSVRVEPDGRELLERMDAGLPLVDEEPELELEVSDEDDEPVLGEVAAVGELADSGAAAADLTPLLGEPERAAASPSTAKPRAPALARWPREAIIEALQAWAAGHDGIPPSSTEWGRATADHPNAVLVKRVFPSWADAVEAAGFPRPRRGVRPKFLASPAASPARTEPQSESNSKTAPKRIRVPGTGLSYRDADEAIAAADAIEADGKRTRDAALDDGETVGALDAFHRALELADKIRAAAGSTVDSSREGAADPGLEEGPRSPTPGIGERDDQQQGMRAPTPAASRKRRTAGAGGSKPAPAPKAAELEVREAPPVAETPLTRLLAKVMSRSDVEESIVWYRAAILEMEHELEIFERTLALKEPADA